MQTFRNTIISASDIKYERDDGLLVGQYRVEINNPCNIYCVSLRKEYDIHVAVVFSPEFVRVLVKLLNKPLGF